MAIAKKPIKHTSEIIPQDESMVEAFISGANRQLAKTRRQNKQPIMIRFDPTLLDKVDEAARHRGVSRSSWIQYVISRALDHGEG